FEHIESYQNNAITGTHEEVSYNAPLPALNVLYHLTDSGDTYGNLVPFSPKHKGTLGVDYKPGNWTFNLNSDFQSSQFADNANTVKESADGSTGRIPGFMLWGARVAYDFGPQMADLNLAFGVKN
ncbi:TonB-dependent receptor domain-containing protein, partial [Shigella flexneri]|uniref:TonB-dependent receptor domain-containing protein n=1 Tax=Shigella flexneri TaxID=623 RepID=UPI0013C363AA